VASIQSKLFHHFLRVIRKKTFLRKQLASGKASIFDCPEPTSKVKRTCHVQTSRVNDRKVFKLTPKNKPKSQVHILYLHGGAYIQSFNRLHWSFLAYLVNKTGCTITAPDYPLAPSATHSDNFAMVTAVYQELITTMEEKNLILMGDSSGGGFALALSQRLRDQNEIQPSRIILLSPWLDITLANPDITHLEFDDPFLEKKSLQQAGRLYAGNTDPKFYLLSPVNGSLNGLGKISVFIGSKEILVADTRKLKAMADAAGIDLDYHEYLDMVHGWMLLDFPESRRVKDQIIDLLRESAAPPAKSNAVNSFG
jgi:epsilon-lactone hydrolase